MTTADYPFETGVYRPPSEGGSASLLVRFTRNCPWNHCTFCAMYKTEKFELRPLEEIKSDINAMADLAQDLKSESMALGHDGKITRETVIALLEKKPGLNHHQGADGDKRLVAEAEEEIRWLQGAHAVPVIRHHLEADDEDYQYGKR